MIDRRVNIPCSALAIIYVVHMTDARFDFISLKSFCG